MLVIDASVTARGDTNTAARNNLDSVDFEAASGATATETKSIVACQCMPDMSIHSSKKLFEHKASGRGHAHAPVTSTHAALLTNRDAADATNACAELQLTVKTTCVTCCAKQADGAWCDCDVLKSSLVHIVNGTNLQESDITISTQCAQLAALLLQRDLL